MSQDQTYAVTLHFRFKRGYTGLLVGQSTEVPAVIVQGKTLVQVRNELFDGLEGYFKAFPDKGKELIEKYGVLVTSQEQKNQMDEKIQNEEAVLEKYQEQLDQEILEKSIGAEWQERKLEKLMTIPA
jgi:hypothetical protein